VRTFAVAKLAFGAKLDNATVQRSYFIGAALHTKANCRAEAGVPIRLSGLWHHHTLRYRTLGLIARSRAAAESGAAIRLWRIDRRRNGIIGVTHFTGCDMPTKGTEVADYELRRVENVRKLDRSV